MAGGQERILRGRIKSVQSTKKITRAMELIAASRIVKAQQRVQAAVPYSELITAMVADLAAAGASADHPLLAGREVAKPKAMYLAIAADRGLCGGYNANVFRAVEGEIKDGNSRGEDYLVVPIGRKAEGYFRFRGYQLGTAFNGFSETPGHDDARMIGEYVVEQFLDGAIDRVELVYTRFVSSGNQEVVLRPLVPLGADVTEGGDGRPVHADGGVPADYEFEPDPSTILYELLPRYVEARIYAALLNGAA